MMYRVCPTDKAHWISVGPMGEAQYCGICGANLIVTGCCDWCRQQGYKFCCVCGRNLAEPKGGK